MKHCELHVHDHYSVLDGAATPGDYMKRAVELGLTHLAQTNHGTTAGWREFQREAKKHDITPILGVEAYLTNDRFDRRSASKRQDGTSVYNHITLLAMNQTGARNIEHMSKIAWTEGFYSKPRMDFDLLEQHNEGVIALSGCMSGMIAKKFLNGLPEQARQDAIYFKDIFGDRFFMEVMESNAIELNQYLVGLGKELGVRPVVTSDCHMARKEDLPLADAMLILNTNPKFDSKADLSKIQKMDVMDAFNYLYPERTMTFQEFELWLHSYEEHKHNLEKHNIGPEAIDNTMLIADQIQCYDYYENLDTLPDVEGVDNAMEELRNRVYVGLKEKDIDTPENRERVEMELTTIEAKDLAEYFLIETDFIDYANSKNILTGYGRGSAVSYLTNYALGITKINPMPYNLLPERFLSVDREDPADIDTDFAIDGRYEVKDYAQRKYPYVSNIATIGYYKDKSAIKAAAKLFKANYAETNKFTANFSTIEEFEKSETTKEYRKKYPHLIELAKKLNGKIQNFGMHAGGIILSKTPIELYAPLQTTTDPSDKAKGRVPVAALDMRELADMGFVKYDLLGLRTLSIVDDTLKLIKQRHGVDIKIDEIPLDDKNIYDMISSGHTAGLFQAEASASTRTIMDMGGVSNFNELVASTALVRPGAANSSVGETYIKGKLTGQIEYLHEETKWFTEETYSAILYQEQQLLLCQEIAGMSPADANKVRKAISKKIHEDLIVWKDEFIAGASQKVGKVRAEHIWNDLEASAEYAFAKAHAVGYSMLTLLTGYLKYYYPLEFLVSCINRMNTSNKSDRMKVLRYMMEARRLGIRIMLPHINASGVDIEIQRDDKGDYIRLGLSNIKGIGSKTARPILAGAPWPNYAALIERANEEGSGIRANTIAALNAVGAAAFDDNPRTGAERDNFFTYLSLPALNVDTIDPRIYSGFDSLRDHEDGKITICMGIVASETRKNGWRRIDIVDEDDAVSVFVSPEAPIEIGQVYVFMISGNSVARYIKPEDLDDDEPFVEFLKASTLPDVPEGMYKVVSFNSRVTKAGRKMANVVLSDEHKNLTAALVFPMQFMKAFAHMREGAVVDVELRETKEGTLFVENTL